MVYLPAVAQLTGGGFFYKSKAHPGMWDTAESAKLILNNLVAAHRAALEQLPARFSEEADSDPVASPGPSPDPDAAAHTPAPGRPAAAQLAGDGSAGPPGKKKAMGAQEGALAGAEPGSEPGKDQGPTVAQVRPACCLRAAFAAVCAYVWQPQRTSWNLPRFFYSCLRAGLQRV